MKNVIQNLRHFKKMTWAILLIGLPLFIVSCDDDDDDMKTSDKNIVEVAQGEPNLSTLVNAIGAAGLSNALQGPGPFTVFAPTNAAFEKMDPTTLNNIISTPSLLTSLLQYHVCLLYTSDAADDASSV